MRILISGICGFVGSTLALALKEEKPTDQIFGFDSFIRPGSLLNQDRLKRSGIDVFYADQRQRSDLESLPVADWIIDAAANASVLAGVDGLTSSRQLSEHNLVGTINILEQAKSHRCGVILLSTSRVYSIKQLVKIPMRTNGTAFQPDPTGNFPAGASPKGLSEAFSTDPPISLYGATKLASEVMALEYGETFKIPVWVNRLGVLAGAGQFGRPDQGIFSYWINSYIQKRPLKYIGFGGTGHQVRDCLHPLDLLPLLRKQMNKSQWQRDQDIPRIINVGGTVANAMSLRALTDWLEARFGQHPVAKDDQHRPFDVGWMAFDCSLAEQFWSWRPITPLPAILQEIADHAKAHPEWLTISQGLAVD